MHLKSLEINGFKSFSKKATLQFTSPISAIVGPNGSGKSNVAEAFRFVLGEQSIKSLRGKRGEDLIFNGGSGPGSGSGSAGVIGASASRANRAGVKVVFDNTKRVLNIDFDEVTLERVVHRDSSNEYFINGSLVRLKDIVELLSSAHIGASGHHIISQGEADRILNANIRERREMIEDALGLKIYQYKKAESQRKLEKTEENMKSVESLRREIAPHIKFLKKQVEKVEKVLEMRTALKGLYQEYFYREEAFLNHERLRLENAKKAPSAEMNLLDQELAHAKSILAESKDADATSGEVIAQEQALAQARTTKDVLARELGKIEGEINAILRSIQKEKEKHARDESKTVYLKDVEEVARHIFGLEGKTDLDMRAMFVSIKTIFTEFISRHKTAQDSGLVIDFEKELQQLNDRKSVFENDLKSASEKEASVHEEYTQLRQKIEREKDTNRDAEKNVFKVIARQNEIRGVLNALKSEEGRFLIEEEAFKRELQEAYAIVGREAISARVILQDGTGEKGELLPQLAVLVPSDIIAEARTIQEDRRRGIEKIKIRIEDSGAGNSAEIMKEYKEVEERDVFLARELLDLETSKASLVALITDLDRRLDIEFKEGIDKINIQFNNFFALMFGGGNAGLNVVREKKRRRRSDTDMTIDDEAIARDIEDSVESGQDGAAGEDEEGDEGIEINVNLPRKKVKNLMMLSGGERALTSIALLFAVSQVNPPPFIILDETDAALDEANSRKYGDMINSLSQYSQLILITHNRETMSRAGILYGVTMGNDGASKLLSIQFEEAVKVAK